MARSSKLLGMAARVARHEVTHQVGQRMARSVERVTGQDVAHRVKQAQVVAESLSQLKGAAMKAGQFLSIDAGDLLPPEARDVLSKLQSDAEPIPFETLRQVLLAELGEEGLGRLAGLDPEPAAAASIGQVHTAEVDGEKVAVKVQYPNVAESIPSDLAVIQRLASSGLALTGRRIPLDDVFEELRAILELEADYRHEAACMQAYGDRLADDDRFLVPKPHPDLSSSRVLTMSWLSGQPLGRWIDTGPTPSRREGVARALLDLYCQEFFEWGFVQTDPNPGNFMILDDGRIGVLDFGATLTYDEAFRREYVELLEIMAQGNPEALVEAGIAFGVLDPREKQDARMKFAEMMQVAARPFAPDAQPFEFGSGDYQRQARDTVFAFTQTLRYTAPPRRLLFLHRKLGGLFNLLKRLDVALDLTPYWSRMIAAPPPAGFDRAATA